MSFGYVRHGRRERRRLGGSTVDARPLTPEAESLNSFAPTRAERTIPRQSLQPEEQEGEDDQKDEPADADGSATPLVCPDSLSAN